MVTIQVLAPDPPQEAAKTAFPFQKNTVHTLADGPTGWLACWLGWAGLGWAGLAIRLGWAGLGWLEWMAGWAKKTYGFEYYYYY